MNYEDNDRIPLIPLDYSQRHLACKKEILFDYKTARLYIVSSTDKAIIYDITQQIVNLVNSDISGDNLIVSIEGIGRVNLKQYLAYIRATTLKAETHSGKKAVPSAAYDFTSISNRAGLIQVHNFWKAGIGDVPFKDDNGILKWTNTEGIYPIQTLNPGADYIIRLKEPFNTSIIDTGCIVELLCKNSNDNIHNTIYWKVSSGTSVPSIRFHSNTNVVLEYSSDLNMTSHAIHIYKFETWDKGMSWLESVKKYNTIQKETNKVDTEFLYDTFYTKEEVRELLKWKNNNMQSIDG